MTDWSRSDNWPFDQTPNVAAITTVNVLERGAPVLVVVHYADDHSWAFLCGLTNDDSDGRVIGMGEAVGRDPTLREIADLPPGWRAQRARVGDPWHREIARWA
jgi:hypothetical protein